MSLPKCPHGCYNSKIDGEPSDYCTGCNSAPPTPSLKEIIEMESAWNKLLENSGL